MTPHFSAEFIWMERIISFAVVLQSIEFLQIRQSFTARGIWPWKIVRDEFRAFPLPLRSGLDFFLNDRNFVALLAIRTALAVAAPFSESAVIWSLLWMSTLFITLRWRGTFNGGSDYMTLIVLMAAFAGRAFGGAHPQWIAVSLGYVGLQTVLSFFIAGVAKIRSAKWRNGSALNGFLNSDYYGTPARVRSSKNATAAGALARIGSWGIITFECLFPVAFFHPQACAVLIACAVFFQVVNTYVFGLNRFIWAWGAAYPALYWCSVYLTRKVS